MLIKNVNILTLNDANEIIYNASVHIKDTKIEKIIPQGMPLPQDNDIIDGKGMLLMPGFINTHTHSAMTFLRNYGNDMNLQDWLFTKIFPAEDKLNAEMTYWFNLLANIEFTRSGVTTHLDNYFFMDTAARAVEKAGTRAVLSRSVSGISDPDLTKLGESVDFYRSDNGYADNRISVVLGAHSIYTSNEDYIRKVVDAASRIGSGLVCHLSETKKEVSDCFAERGISPAEYLDKLGYFDVNGIKVMAHCVHLSDDDISILKSKGVSAAINMSSNLKLASGIAEAPKLMASGINVTLGTDGASSNNNLSMFNEIRLASLVYKGITGDPEIMNADTVLKLATVNGAKAICKNDLGIVAEGMTADLILINTDSPSIAPANELPAAVVYSASASDVDTVICNGRIIMKNRELLNVDEEEVIFNVKKYTKQILG